MRARLGVILVVAVVGMAAAACSPEQKPDTAGKQEQLHVPVAIAPKNPPPALPSAGELKAVLASGGKLFTTSCASCHDPSGADGIGPGLAGSPVAKGSAGEMATILVHGRSGERGTMPGAPFLTDPEIAAIGTYVRAQFGKVADPLVTEAQVAAKR